MEATQRKIQLRQQYWVTKGSKVKLLQLGAKCVDTVLHRQHYYDTALGELAMAQLWLSQRNQQWRLIVGALEQTIGENIATYESIFDTEELPYQNRTHVQKSKSTVNNLQQKKPTQSEPPGSQNDHYDVNKTQVCVKLTSTHIELVGKHEIIMYLTDFLHIELTAEEETNMTMEDFLQKAGIYHYASNLTACQSTYILCDQYTITIQMEESSLKESATVLLDVEMSSICKGFEEIEHLANYLEFEHQTVQREQELLIQQDRANSTEN